MAGDARLLRASLRGDHDAFARIVRRYQSLVCAITYSGTGDLAASEDLAQETFLAAWQRLASLREPTRLRSWLCTIARNRTTDYLRRRQHDVAAEAMPVEDAPAVESALPSPADHAATKERERLVWDALSEMPDTYRLPLVLYYREDQSVRKVARALDLSHSAVKLRLMRGRGMLRERMAALVEDTLSTTGPGASFGAAVLAGLGATAAKKAAGAGSTLLGLSLPKAAAVGVLAAGAAVGAAVALRPDAPERAPAVAVAQPADPPPAETSWPVHTDDMPDGPLILAEMHIETWVRFVQIMGPLLDARATGTESLADFALENCHTDDPSTLDLTKPLYALETRQETSGGLTCTFSLVDPDRYVRSLQTRIQKVAGEENLYAEGPPETGTILGVFGDRAVIAHGGLAHAREIMALAQEGVLPAAPLFPSSAMGYIIRAQPMLGELDRLETRDNIFNDLREKLGITRDYKPAGPHPLSALVEGVEELCLHQWDRLAAVIDVGGADVTVLWQFRTMDDTSLQRGVANYPVGPVGLLQFVPANSSAVLACKLPDVALLLTGTGVPADSLPGRAFGLLGDEAALAFGCSPKGPIRLLLALRVRDPAGASQFMDQIAALVGGVLQGGPPLRLTRSETLYNSHPIKVWDFDVVQPPGGERALGTTFALGADLKLYECLAGDALLLAFGDDVVPQVQAALDGTLRSMADSPRFAEAMTGMPTTAPLVCCVEVEKLAGWVVELLGPTLPPLQGLDFGEGPPVVLLAHVIGGKVAELRGRLPLGAIAAGVKWRKAFPPPARPAAPPPAAPRQAPDLHGSAWSGDLEQVERVLAEGADVNARLPGGGRTALHNAAERGHADVVRLLMDNGADVNAEDDRRSTPLHAAAREGHRAVVEALLAADADVNATDLGGRTPTGLAVRAGHEDVANLLREHGGVE